MILISLEKGKCYCEEIWGNEIKCPLLEKTVEEMFQSRKKRKT